MMRGRPDRLGHGGCLHESLEAATAANQLLGAERRCRALPKADGDLRARARSLAGALCELIDPKNNPIGLMISQAYRDQHKRLSSNPGIAGADHVSFATNC